eukprot:245067-Pyramimonas_sp.AAC.1
MMCNIPGHKKCSRTRTWKDKTGEEIALVDRALVRWLQLGEAVTAKPGETLTMAHMKLPRD